MKYIKTVSEVVHGGYCVGCGGCAVNNPSVKMVMSVDGQYLPDSAIDNEKNLSVNGDFCPFISEVDEDTLADDHREKGEW